MLLRCLAAMLVIASWVLPARAADPVARFHVGQTSREFRPAVARNWRGAAEHGLVTMIWYPVDLDRPEAAHDIGERGAPIFHGHPVANDAPLAAAQASYPLLVLSHGTGGTAMSLDWLASALAANGYIVAGVNHPGNNSLAPLTWDGFALWWERATDLSEVLDGVLADPVLGPHIDPKRIGAVGFSLGGYTVLELAGARTNVQAFLDFCRSPQADAICHAPEMKVLPEGDAMPRTLSAEEQASVANAGASYRDQRVRAVFAIAPALGEAFDDQSFAQVHVPVSLVAGSADTTVPVATNIHRIAAFLPEAKVTMLPGASHYTFLDTCMPAVVERLTRVCKDGADIDRDAIHERAASLALDFFMTTLAAQGSQPGGTD